jgi:hypothetical protein
MTPAEGRACSLSAPAGAERAARWRRLLHDHLLDRSSTATGQRLAFGSSPVVAAELDALVAAERECCPFLDLAVVRSGDRLILTVDAPPEAAAIVAAMFAARWSGLLVSGDGGN